MNNLMVNIGVPEEGAKELLNSFTLPVIEFGSESGLLPLLRENIHINMKTVKYTPYDKVVELLASIVAGCQHTVTINSRLVPDTVLAEELIGKDRFADQSGINRLLQSITYENVDELERVFSAYYMTHGIAWKKESVVVDIDMTGFKANGKTYENTEKGYICEKGDRGYKATFAYTDKEVIGMVFGKGNEVEVNQINDILKVIKERIGSPKIKDIIIRGDAGFGISTIIDILYSQSFLFILKGKQRSSAKRFSRRIKNWIAIPNSPDELAYGEMRAKVTGSKHKFRIIIFRMKKNGDYVYFHIITNLPDILYPAETILKMYNERQSIEAFIKADKSGLHIKNLRTRRYNGIRYVILLSSIAFNMISYFINSGITKKKTGVKAFVEKLSCARGWFIRKGNAIVLYFSEETPVVKQYLKYSRGPMLR